MTSTLDVLRQEVRHTIRALRRAPGFTLVVALTLALGIGLNAAIFSIVDQLLLRPLPYAAGDRILRVHEFSNSRGTSSDVNPGNWLEWQRQSRTLESFAAWDWSASTLTGAGEPERLQVLLVSAEFFPLFGVQPLFGRTITADDDQPGAPRVIVLTHGLWQRRFNGDPKVIGRIVQLGETPCEIIGVMPSDFKYIGEETDGWTAFRLDRTRAWRDTAGRFMSVVARAKAGVTLDDAQTEMITIARELESHPRNAGMTVKLVPIYEELVGDVKLSVLVLFAAGLVLLGIVCLNVTNLFVARALSRRRDIAIRSSLGAARTALVRHSLLESIVLAGLGGTLGILFARWAMTVLVALTPADIVPLGSLGVDSRVLAYLIGITGLTGIVVGLAPTMLAIRSSLAPLLRSGVLRTTLQSRRMRQSLIVAQVAMTVVLLCGAGLLVRTVIALNRSDAGFDRQDLLTMEIALPTARYDDLRTVDFFRRVRERFQVLPGVESAAAGSSLPVIGPLPGSSTFQVLGQPETPPAERPTSAVRVITPGYFRTLGAPVLRGREFTDADQAPGAPLVFVVNEAFASRFLSGQDPLDTAISVAMQDENPYARIVGVVGDMSEGSLWDSGRPTVFYNHRQIPMNAMVMFLRAAGVTRLTREAAAAVHEIDPNLAIVNARTIDTAFGDSLGRERLLSLVSGTFALSGLLLASLGLYGLLTFVVAGQTKEIGVQIALGVPLGRLLRGVLMRGLLPVAVGIAFGLVGAVLISRSLAFLFFGVSPYDAWTYSTVVTLLAVVAGVASIVPACRAARIDPVVALRAD